MKIAFKPSTSARFRLLVPMVMAALATILPAHQTVMGQDVSPGQFDHLFDDEGAFQVTIEKEVKEDSTRPPIAVPAALGADKLPGEHGESIAEILRFDFQISGQFSKFPAKKTLFDAEEGLEDEDVNFNRWASSGAQYLVKSRYTVQDDGMIALDMRFYDVRKQKTVELKWTPKPFEVDALRDNVHAFANAVMEYMTGTSGPFGTRLVLAILEGDEKHIYTMDMDGARRTRVTQNKSINVLPSWSKDGGVYYTSYMRANPDLYLSHNGGAKLISSVPGTNHGAAACGDKVALTLSMGGTNTDIYVLNATSGRLKARLTDHWGIDTSPSWSPDCKRLAFVSDRSGNPQIYTMNADGSNQRRLTYSGRNNTTPEWSPKGDEIAFTGVTGGGADIFVASLDGYMRRLTWGRGTNESPTWGPNGNFIAYISQRRQDPPQLYIMPINGQRHTLITQDGGIYATPSWRR